MSLKINVVNKIYFLYSVLGTYFKIAQLLDRKINKVFDL